VCGAPKERFQPLAVAGEGATASAAKTRVVVVGAGIAGISAMESLRSACPDAKIALVSKEEVLPYFRLNLTRYLAGEVQKDELPLHDPDWYEAQRIEVHLGAEITGLDVEDKTIALRDGRSLPFEKLILTIGSHPFIPPFPGAQRDGVASFRTLDDAERLLEAAKTGMKCICIGGGILGLETAGALARQGVDVTLLESHDWLMPRQLNPEAGARLKAFAEGVGIRILEQSRTAEIVGDERAAGVRLEDGTLIDGDLVVITAGVRPNSHIARRAGLEVNKGLVVNNHLQSSHPDVFAAGDVAEHHGVLYGNWSASQYQGGIAGMNAVGQSVEFGGIPRSNMLKVLGLNMLSMGRFMPEDGSDVVIEEEKNGAYLRFVFHDGCMVGSVLLGDTSISAPLKKAMEGGTDFSGLLARKPTAAEVAAHLAG
jgi:nitrite reductase (NADH) large subunit